MTEGSARAFGLFVFGLAFFILPTGSRVF
jgi:hypothetical protein